MRLTRCSLVVAGVALAAILTSAAVGIHAGQEPQKLRIIYSNDCLGEAKPCG